MGDGAAVPLLHIVLWATTPTLDPSPQGEGDDEHQGLTLRLPPLDGEGLRVGWGQAHRVRALSATPVPGKNDLYPPFFMVFRGGLSRTLQILENFGKMRSKKGSKKGQNGHF